MLLSNKYNNMTNWTDFSGKFWVLPLSFVTIIWLIFHTPAGLGLTYSSLKVDEFILLSTFLRFFDIILLNILTLLNSHKKSKYTHMYLNKTKNSLAFMRFDSRMQFFMFVQRFFTRIDVAAYFANKTFLRFRWLWIFMQLDVCF